MPFIIKNGAYTVHFMAATSLRNQADKS